MKRRTFPQMNPRVGGFAWPPSILTTRPFSTVTSSVQESGQSSGHAVRTVERPHVTSGSAPEVLRGMADYRTPSPRRRQRDLGERDVQDGVFVPVLVVEVPPLLRLDRERFPLHRGSEEIPARARLAVPPS